MPTADRNMAPRWFRVRRNVRETNDSFTLQLESENGDGGLSFGAGQFNMLYAFGIGEVPISVSGDPGKPESLVHTIRAVGKVTQALCKSAKGTRIGVRGPFGTEWPLALAEGKDVIIVAGGIGLAPLRPALYYLLNHRTSYGRINLLYGARTSEDLLFVKELEGWRARFDLDVGVTVDRGTRNWRGKVGVVPHLIAGAGFDPTDSMAFVCGPEIMMRFTVMELQRCGMQDHHIYVSLERNMKCGIGLCGHCQCGMKFICRDGPVFSYNDVAGLLRKREL